MPRHIVSTRRARACCRRLNIPASLRRRLSVPPRWFYPLGLWGEDDALTASCHDGAIRVLRLAERYRACKTSRESILDADGGQFCAPIDTPRLRDLQATWHRKHGVEGRCQTPLASHPRARPRGSALARALLVAAVDDRSGRTQRERASERTAQGDRPSLPVAVRLGGHG
jgi:hypothetical protein